MTTALDTRAARDRRDWFYRLVRATARFWLWFFFKSVDVRHPERVPDARLDGRRARDRRGPPEDLLGRAFRVAAAARQRARAARRAAEGPALRGDDGLGHGDHP